MKRIILFLTVVFIGFYGCTSTSKIPNELKSQQKYLFKELVDNELFLGLAKDDLLLKRPKAEENSDGFDFREIYIDTAFSQRFNTLIYYIDREGTKPVYEFILLVDNRFDAKKLAKEKYGEPNYKDEWRFSKETTKLPYDIAVWTFKNKVIIAGTIEGTEWEEGIE